MLPEITISIAIIGCVISVISFFNGRKDKANDAVREEASSMAVINTKLEYITKQIDGLTTRFDKHENDIDTKIEKAVQQHIKTYHSK